jgi:hypothetical protein
MQSLLSFVYVFGLWQGATTGGHDNRSIAGSHSPPQQSILKFNNYCLKTNIYFNAGTGG